MNLNLKQILADLADVRVVLGLLIASGGVITALAQADGGPGAVKIVALVLTGAGIAVALITAVEKAFGSGVRAAKAGKA